MGTYTKVEDQFTGSLIRSGFKGNHSTDIKIYKPDKEGNLKLIKVKKMDYRTSRLSQTDDFACELFICKGCGMEDTRTAKAKNKKTRCYACREKHKKVLKKKRKEREAIHV